MPLIKFRNTPGVYTEEIALFPPSVAPVETAIPAFIGYTDATKKEDQNLIGKPIRISSMLQFDEYFLLNNEDGRGKKVKPEENIQVSLTGSKEKFAIEIKFDETSGKGKSKNILRYAMQLFFANGGSDCYVVSVGKTGKSISFGAQTPNADPENIGINAALDALKLEDEPTIILCPEAVEGLTEAEQNSLIDAILQQCVDLQDRVGIFDVPMLVGADTNNKKDPVLRFREWVPSEIEINKYGAAYYPFLKTTFAYPYDEKKIVITDSRGVAPASGATGSGTTTPTTPGAGTTTPPDTGTTTPATPGSGTTPTSTTPATAPSAPSAGGTLSELNSKDNPLYNAIKAKLNEFYIILPPSSAIAGIYARVDNLRGVWKAPANVSVNAVIEPTIKINDRDQDPLNVDPTAGKSINAIRSFTGRGTLVWGARTLAGNDNEWRYISVRRFFNFVEESVKKASARFVFEPNSKNTWVKVKAMIENFLIVQWRAGALVGDKPEHAFYVKVGLNETMSAEDILNGYMVVEIGMAVVRPAEFIILQFSHKMQES